MARQLLPYLNCMLELPCSLHAPAGRNPLSVPKGKGDQMQIEQLHHILGLI